MAMKRIGLKTVGRLEQLRNYYMFEEKSPKHLLYRGFFYIFAAKLVK